MACKRGGALAAPGGRAAWLSGQAAAALKLRTASAAAGQPEGARRRGDAYLKYAISMDNKYVLLVRLSIPSFEFEF